MSSPDFPSLKPDDISKLMEMGISQELSQYFGHRVKLEPLDDLESAYKVVGLLESGIMQGGKSFSMNVRTVDVDGGDGSDHPVWQLEDIVVNGLNVSKELVAPVYISRRYIEPTVDNKLATFEHLEEDLSAFAVPSRNQIVLPKFSKLDDLAILIHENTHIKSIPHYTKLELEEAVKFYRLIQQIFKRPNPSQEMKQVREDAIQNEYLPELQRWAYSYFLQERVANETTMYYFKDHEELNFDTEDDGHRYSLSKLLTSATLSYAQLINNFLGRGTITPDLVEYN